MFIRLSHHEFLSSKHKSGGHATAALNFKGLVELVSPTSQDNSSVP